MKEKEFLEWFENHKLNLNGWEVYVRNQLISKDNRSYISISCDFVDGIWKVLEDGPDDKSSHPPFLVYESENEDKIFDDLKQYLEAQDYFNNYYEIENVKKFIEKIQNENFSMGVKLVVNNKVLFTNKVLSSDVTYCCNKENDEWLIYDEGPEDRSEPKGKYILFRSKDEEMAFDFFFKRLKKEERIYNRRLQKRSEQ